MAASPVESGVRRFRLRLPIKCSELKRSGDLTVVAILLRAAVGDTTCTAQRKQGPWFVWYPQIDPAN